jgi:hypothetical protein
VGHTKHFHKTSATPNEKGGTHKPGVGNRCWGRQQNTASTLFFGRWGSGLGGGPGRFLEKLGEWAGPWAGVRQQVRSRVSQLVGGLMHAVRARPRCPTRRELRADTEPQAVDAQVHHLPVQKGARFRGVSRCHCRTSLKRTCRTNLKGSIGVAAKPVVLLFAQGCNATGDPPLTDRDHQQYAGQVFPMVDA